MKQTVDKWHSGQGVVTSVHDLSRLMVELEFSFIKLIYIPKPTQSNGTLWGIRTLTNPNSKQIYYLNDLATDLLRVHVKDAEEKVKILRQNVDEIRRVNKALDTEAKHLKSLVG